MKGALKHLNGLDAVLGRQDIDLDGFDTLVFSYQEDKGADAAALNGVRRHGQGVFEHIELELDIGELIGKQSPLFVVQDGLDLQGRGRHIDGVVGGEQAALGQDLALVPVVGHHGEGRVGAQFLLDQGHMGLGDREHHGHRLGLGDGDDPSRIRASHQRAQIDAFQAQTPLDRRRHFGVADIEFGRVNLGLVGLHGAFELLDQGLLGVELLLGDGVLGPQFFVALGIQLRVVKQSRVFVELAQGLGQSHVISPGVHLRQHFARLDHFALLKPNGLEFTVDLGANRGRVHGGQGSNGVERQVDVHALNRRGTHRLGPTSSPKPTAKAPESTAGPGSTWSTWSTRTRLALLIHGGIEWRRQEPCSPVGVPPVQGHDQRHDQHGQHGGRLGSSRLAVKVNVRGMGIGHGGSFKVQELHMKQIFSPIIHCKTKSIL